MVSPVLRDLRINAVELLRQPGTTRLIHVAVDPGEIGVGDDRITGPATVALSATSSVDGIVVAGTVATPWHASCRRCLVDVSGVSIAQVDEMYQDVPSSDDATAIAGDQIDLAPVVREYVLLELPDAPLCRDDCAGICAACGVDLNTETCDCVTSVRDERWSALDDVRLDPE